MGLDIEFIEFNRAAIEGNAKISVDEVDTAVFEGEPPRIRQYLTFGWHLGPQVWAKELRRKLEDPFHAYMVDKFGFFEKGCHYLISFDEMKEIMTEYASLNPDDYHTHADLVEIFEVVDFESNFLSYIWC